MRLYDQAVNRKGKKPEMRNTHLKWIALALALCIALTVGSAMAFADDSSTYIYSYDDMFTKRDLKQTADLTGAVEYTVTNGQDIRITDEGVYVLTGSASEVTVYVEAGEEDKVQLVLDDLAITNSDAPTIYVNTADKVFVTVSGDSSLSVTGSFDSSDKADGVIYSKCDIVFNGSAALTVSSPENGIVGKDDLKITGGTYTVMALSKAIVANDSIRIADGTLNLTAGTDGLHAENSDDDSLGYIYIAGGTIDIQASDDCIHAASVIQINDGKITVTGSEGLEGTCIQINGGTLSVSGTDDGINAGQKSDSYKAEIEINGGSITIVMASGDTDGIDSNGDIVVNGGVISVTGGSTFDCDGTATYNGGSIIVNGQKVSYIPVQTMGGGRGFGR